MTDRDRPKDVEQLDEAAARDLEETVPASAAAETNPAPPAAEAAAPDNDPLTAGLTRARAPTGAAAAADADADAAAETIAEAREIGESANAAGGEEAATVAAAERGSEGISDEPAHVEAGLAAEPVPDLSAAASDAGDTGFETIDGGSPNVGDMAPGGRPDERRGTEDHPEERPHEDREGADERLEEVGRIPAGPDDLFAEVAERPGVADDVGILEHLQPPGDDQSEFFPDEAGARDDLEGMAGLEPPSVERPDPAGTPSIADALAATEGPGSQLPEDSLAGAGPTGATEEEASAMEEALEAAERAPGADPRAAGLIGQAWGWIVKKTGGPRPEPPERNAAPGVRGTPDPEADHVERDAPSIEEVTREFRETMPVHPGGDEFGTTSVQDPEKLTAGFSSEEALEQRINPYAQYADDHVDVERPDPVVDDAVDDLGLGGDWPAGDPSGEPEEPPDMEP
jgi:hypothetical protein